MATAVEPSEVMDFLNALFLRFDALLDAVEKHGVYKVETIGGMRQQTIRTGRAAYAAPGMCQWYVAVEQLAQTKGDL